MKTRIVAAVEEEGMGKEAAARRFKVDRTTVCRYLKRAGQGENVTRS